MPPRTSSSATIRALGASRAGIRALRLVVQRAGDGAVAWAVDRPWDTSPSGSGRYWLRQVPAALERKGLFQHRMVTRRSRPRFRLSRRAAKPRVARHPARLEARPASTGARSPHGATPSVATRRPFRIECSGKRRAGAGRRAPATHRAAGSRRARRVRRVHPNGLDRLHSGIDRDPRCDRAVGGSMSGRT